MKQTFMFGDDFEVGSGKGLYLERTGVRRRVLIVTEVKILKEKGFFFYGNDIPSPSVNVL